LYIFNGANFRKKARVGANTKEELGVFMGWRSKLFLLIVVYFAGFFSAVYFVASGNDNYQANDKAAKIVNTINTYSKQIYNKASEKCSQLDKQDFTDAYNKGVEAINNIQDKYASAQPDAQ
jgi:hypothetical protein